MNFIVEKHWETHDTNVLLYGDSVRQIPLVQLPLNLDIFHIDILLTEDYDDFGWNRYITSDIVHLLAILEDFPIKESRISVQQTRNETGEYAIFDVKNILKCFSENGGFDYLIKCKSGKEITWPHSRYEEKIISSQVLYAA